MTAVLIFNLQPQMRQMAVDQLKANRSFDDPLAQSLQQQIDEINDEIKQYAANLHSILELEITTPFARILLQDVGSKRQGQWQRQQRAR